MTDRNPFPPLSPELIQALDERFPERCPDIAWTDREVWRRVGQREVVRLLIKELADQNENVLENPILV